MNKQFDSCDLSLNDNINYDDLTNENNEGIDAFEASFQATLEGVRRQDQLKEDIIESEKELARIRFEDEHLP